jgi:hypothetical protein
MLRQIVGNGTKMELANQVALDVFCSEEIFLWTRLLRQNELTQQDIAGGTE